MVAYPAINEAHLEAISKVIGDTYGGLTGSEIGRCLNRCRIEDPVPSSTKWKRLYAALSQRQQQDLCANNILNFIKTAMNPSLYLDKRNQYESMRVGLNEALAFAGYHLSKDGQLRPASQAKTLDEAAIRASELRESLQRRSIHPDVLKFCQAELLQENYFHSVLESAKSMAQKIRDRTGLTSDGAQLVDEAFSVKSPRLALNTLRTETEKMDQKGFVNLMKGIFGTFRNVPAHAPRIYWAVEKREALDALTMISYAHRRIDDAVELPVSGIK